LIELLRSIPERLKRPESLLMLMAMFASLGAHMPPWLGLGALADYFSQQEAQEERAAPIEVSFEVSDTKPAEEAPAMKDEDPAPKVKQEKLAKVEPPDQKKPEAPKPPEKKEPEVKKLEVAQAPPPPPPPPSQDRRQSITQKSEDPDVEPPPDAKFLAEESRRVEEESVASVLSPTRDDPVPEKSAPEAANEPERAGDARQDEKGEMEGADKPQEAVVARPQPAPAPSPEQSASVQRPAPAPSRVPSPRAPSAPSAPSVPEGTVIQDPLGGSFVLAQPKRSSAPVNQQNNGTTASGAPVNIKVSWRAFEETFGAEQLAKDRMPAGAKRRGAGREKRWKEFRAAIENYVVGVKPGNQTALNAAADPFAAYLAAFHRHLHMEFAHQFLESLPLTGKLGDPSLMAKVEIVVNPDGSLDRVGIVKSSGDLMYDFGAFNAVQRGAPYPPPPEKIRSTDGRTYMRWALYRNESQCGTWNAEPYILKSPPRSPSDPKQDNVSPYQNPSAPSESGRRPPSEPAHVPSDSGKAPGETLGMTVDPRKLGLVARR
jgi:TonB family protein